MSNKVKLQATKFINVRGKDEGSYTFGFRLFDDYESVFMDEGEVSGVTSEDDFEFLKYVVDNANGKIEDMLDSVVENEKGMEINGMWYDWDEIKDIVLVNL